MGRTKKAAAKTTPSKDCPAEQAGISEPAVPAFKTLDEVASHFEVSRRTVMDWRGQGMPWREGGFPQSEIFGWVALHKRRKVGSHDGDPREIRLARRRTRAEARLAISKARREELRLAREEGRYADLETLLRVCERSIAEARSYLACLPDECVARLGSIKLTARAKTELRGLVSDAVRKAEAAVVAALSAWADELEAENGGSLEQSTGRASGTQSGEQEPDPAAKSGGTARPATGGKKTGRGVAATRRGKGRRLGAEESQARAQPGG